MANRLNSAMQRAAAQLRSPALVAYGISAAVAGASFLTTFLLARFAGPAVIGDYALAISTATLLGSLAMLGLERIVIREVAGEISQQNFSIGKSIIVNIFIAITIASFLTSSIFILINVLLGRSHFLDYQLNNYLSISLLAAIYPLLRFGISSMRALRMAILAQFLEAAPTFLMVIFVFVYFSTFDKIDAIDAIFLFIFAQLVAALFIIIIVKNQLNKWGNVERVSTGRAILFSGLPLMAAVFMQYLSDWIIIFQVSNILGAAEAGTYRVAIQIITIIVTLVGTTEAYISARVAGDFRIGRPDIAWSRHNRATALLVVCTSPIFACVFLAPEWLLSTLFSPSFGAGSSALVIMAAAQLFSVLRGPIGALLVMGGFERLQMKLTFGSLLLSTALSFWLIPTHGLLGAAIAYAAPVTFRSVCMYAVAKICIPNRKGVGGSED